MKKILVIAFAAQICFACNDNDSNQTKPGIVKTDTAGDADFEKFKQAREYADHIFVFMNDYTNGKITVDQFDKKAKPWQQKMDSIEKLLTPESFKMLNDYRQQVLNSIVNGGYNKKKYRYKPQ